MGILKEMYELTEDYLQVMEMVDDDDWDEQTVKDTLEGVFGEIEFKAESIAKMIKMQQAQADIAKAEADRLLARAKSYNKKADFFKTVLFENLKAMNVKKVKTPLFTISISKNGGLDPLSITGNIEDIPGKYLIPQAPIPDKDAIRKLLAEKEVEWARLEPRGEHLGIR